jgi:hypothetical protein
MSDYTAATDTTHELKQATIRRYKLDGLVWFCPQCGQSIESAGTDESSRNAVRAFKVRHRHKEKE